MCGHLGHHHQSWSGHDEGFARWPTAPERGDAVPQEDVNARAPEHRVSDADREEVVALLRAAGGAGLLEPDELAERTGAALTAKIAGELAPLTADLPPAWRERGRRESRRHERAGRAREELGGHVRAYVGVMVLLVGIWLSVALTGGGWYPWPVWPALGWGLGLASHARNARPHPARAL